MKTRSHIPSNDPSEIADALFWSSLQRYTMTFIGISLAASALFWSGCHLG